MKYCQARYCKVITICKAKKKPEQIYDFKNKSAYKAIKIS